MRSKFCELLAIRGVDGLMISFVSNVKFELHAKVIKQISTIKFSGLQCFRVFLSKNKLRERVNYCLISKELNTELIQLTGLNTRSKLRLQLMKPTLHAENTQHKGKYHCTAHFLFFYLDSAALHLFY